jgi:hypothetical protein
LNSKSLKASPPFSASALLQIIDIEAEEFEHLGVFIHFLFYFFNFVEVIDFINDIVLEDVFARNLF